MKDTKLNKTIEDKGITLIALVVTIIVLLILAGISISMLTGQNGILNRAEDAKSIYEESTYKEQLEIEVLGNYMDKNELNIETLKENIEKNIDNSEIINDEFPLLVKNKKTNSIYLIENDGTVILYDENAVARIKDKFYETLQLAINAVPDDNNEKEIILLKDISENVSIPQNKNIILNLNNKTMNSEDQTAINSSGSLIIKGGTVKSENRHALYNQGTTTIENAFLTSTSTGIATITSTANSSLTILNSTIESKNQVAIYTYGGSNTLITGNSTQIISKKDCVNSAGELMVDGGDFYSETQFALHAIENSNIKINKGIFNNGRSDLWPGVVQLTGTGTITIGNIGDNNEDILINNNDNRNICGIGFGGDGGTTLIINSGNIRGYAGIDMAVKNSKLYLNGGTIVGTGGTAEAGSGWSVTLNSANGNTTGVNIYLKNNSGVSLSGRGLSGKNSIRWTQYVTEVD